jgi:hypothetical protein
MQLFIIISTLMFLRMITSPGEALRALLSYYLTVLVIFIQMCVRIAEFRRPERVAR